MEQLRFEAVLVLLVPQLINLIQEHTKLDEVKAINRLYSSELYTLLEQEDTKLWHLSAPTLYTMFDEEQKTGKISFPEEA